MVYMRHAISFSKCEENKLCSIRSPDGKVIPCSIAFKDNASIRYQISFSPSVRYVYDSLAARLVLN